MLHIDVHKKLAKANKVMEKIAREFEFITPVTLEDQALFESFFNKEERDTYGNSWIYVTQGVYGIGENNLGYKYYDGENLCMLGISPKIEQPDIIMLYWVRPLGNAILPVIVKLSEKIKKEFGICSYVKKLFPDQYQFLLSQGFKSVQEFAWHSTAPSEDDTFPELIFDKTHTLDLMEYSNSSSSLKRIFKEVNKLIVRNEIKLSGVNFSQHAWHIICRYFSERPSFSKKANFSNEFDYYHMIMSNLLNPFVERKILLINNKPEAFYVLEKNIKFNTINIYALVGFWKKYKYLLDYVRINIFKLKGIKYVNSGGSEDTGIHNFKLKYKPIKKNKMYWVTNYPL